MEIFFATTNKHKVEEISQMLKTYGVEIRQKPLEIIEPDYDTIEQIARAKARDAFAQIKRAVIAEDTGVYFDAYNNFPGVLAKRVFMGIGFDGLMLLIKNAKNKSAHFKTAICYFDGKEEKTFSGTLRGRLVDRVVSVEKDRLPYEKLFVPEGFTYPIVDMPLDEKNKISHRAKAAHALGKWLSEKKN